MKYLVEIILVVIVVIVLFDLSSCVTYDNQLNEHLDTPPYVPPNYNGKGCGAEPVKPTDVLILTEYATPTDNARTACDRVSTRAENLKEEAKGRENLVNGILGWLTPNNLAAGENKVIDSVRNIIERNLSTCDIKNINQSCGNTSTVVQSNVLDNSECSYCKDNPSKCLYENVNQINDSTIKQICTMNAVITHLATKKNDVDALALTKILQETSGLLSGNNEVQTEKCNVVRDDMSSKQYSDIRQDCLQQAAVKQENIIKACGVLKNVTQKNISDLNQECVVMAEAVSVVDLAATAKTRTEYAGEQKSTGITLSEGCIGLLICVGILFCGSCAAKQFFPSPVGGMTDPLSRKRKSSYASTCLLALGISGLSAWLWVKYGRDDKLDVEKTFDK
jgi:hypothetical protein